MNFDGILSKKEETLRHLEYSVSLSPSFSLPFAFFVSLSDFPLLITTVDYRVGVLMGN